MDTYNDPEIEEVAFCKPTQVGGTQAGHNILGYAIDQDPASFMVVYPSEKLAKSVSKNRIQPMLQLTPVLADKWLEKESQTLELQFLGMYISFVGANSPGNLSSKPLGRLIFDETDKYPDFSGDEAEPVSLGRERSKNFLDRKIYIWSTPTIESKPVWQAFISSEVQKQFFVPCPHCGEYQTFKFAQIKWPEELKNISDYTEKARQVEELAWYECEECHEIIQDRQKSQMLKLGEWRPVAYDLENGTFRPTQMPKGRIKRVGYQLNSIYSPWITFGNVAKEFILAKDFPGKLMNFVNSWLGEIWRNKTNSMKSDSIWKKKHTTPKGIVPFDVGETILTGGIDRQKDHFWYVIHAWGPGFTGRLVDYGQAETWADLDKIFLERRYYNLKNQAFRVMRVMIDSGYDTDAVYDYCAMNKDIFLPCKGANRKLTAPFSISSIEKKKDGKQWFNGLKLYEVDTDYFKDFIFGRLEREPDALGSWTLFSDCPQEFADHICSERKNEIQDKKTKKITFKYLPIGSHAINHLLDCSVYSACAAESIGVRYLRKTEEVKKAAPPKRRVVSKGVRA